MSAKETATLLERLFEFLDPDEIDQLAKETGFVIRKRKLTANDFLSLLFDVHGDLATRTLQESCTNLDAEQMISISRTGFDKKIKKETVLFLQKLIRKLLEHEQFSEPSAHALAKDWPFSSIRIFDSTNSRVPDHQKVQAQKTGQTSVKIQYEFDALSGQCTFFCLDTENINDAVMGAKRIPFLEGQELCLQDMGYFNFNLFKEMEKRESYYITRVRSDAYLAYKNPFPAYHPNGDVVQSSLYERIPLAELCSLLEPGERIELDGVHFGRDAHHQARCIIVTHDANQKDKRIKQIQRRASKSGKQPKQIVTELAGITIYMTNLPEEVSAFQVTELYRLRWQVELQFKETKSYLALADFKPIRQERWLCHLYATLLVFLLSQVIAHQVRNGIWEEEGVEISEMVMFRSIATVYLTKLYEAFRQKKKKTFKDYVHRISRLITKTARKPQSTKGTSLKRLQAS